MSSASLEQGALPWTDRWCPVDGAAELDRLRRRLNGNPYGPAWDAFDGPEYGSVAGRLPPWLAGALDEFRRDLGCSGVLRISGIPLPDVPPTPVRPFVEVREPVGTEGLLLACARRVGTPIGFADWHDGDRVQNMYPLREQAARQNANNAVDLEMHTETAFRPTTPDVLMLLGLRTRGTVHTRVADLGAAWRAQPASVRRVLARPRFSFPLDDGSLTEGRPVFHDGSPPRWHYAEALRGVDDEAQAALRALEETLTATCGSVAIEAGDLLVLDNRHVVHGRSPQQPGYDGGDRWVQRCLVRTT